MKENKMMIDQPVSWRDYPAWLTDFQDSIPESLATPPEIAAFEAEQFTGSGRGKGHRVSNEEWGKAFYGSGISLSLAFHGYG